MHNAPAVAYPVGRSRFQAWLMATLLGCASLVLALWCTSVAAIDWPQVWAGALTAVIAAAMLRSWWRAPQGQLVWDGSVWVLSLQAASDQAKPELILDFQVALLLRLGGRQNHPNWVWLERSMCVPRWLALRRAVHDGAGFKVPDTPELVTALERAP